MLESGVRAWYSSVVFERGVRAWCSSVVFERGIRVWCSRMPIVSLGHRISLEHSKFSRFALEHQLEHIHRYDATFAETEMSQCITEVRRLDPEFNLHLWLDEMKDDTIPHVIQSYLRMDDESLLEHLSEGAMAQVGVFLSFIIPTTTTTTTTHTHTQVSAAIKVRRDEVSFIFFIFFLSQQIGLED